MLFLIRNVCLCLLLVPSFSEKIKSESLFVEVHYSLPRISHGSLLERPNTCLPHTWLIIVDMRQTKSMRVITKALKIAYINYISVWISQVKRPMSNFDPSRFATQFPVTRNSQIKENLLKSSFSRAILDIYSQLFYGKYIRRSSFYSFLTVFWILSGRIRRKILFFVDRVGEKDNVKIFSLSRSAWGF